MRPRSRRKRPRQFACQSGCGNAIRTDSHAELLRNRAAELEGRAGLTPEPLGNRLRHGAARLRALADGHDTIARPAEELE